MKLRTKLNLRVAAMLGVIAVCSPGAHADLAKKYSFSIQPQSLSSALIEFSKQADVQVVGNATTFANLTTEGISGEHTGREALTMLIGRLPITFEEVTGRAVRILPRKAEIAGNPSNDGMKVAQGESEKTSSAT